MHYLAHFTDFLLSTLLSLSNVPSLFPIALFRRCVGSYVWQRLTCDLVSGNCRSAATRGRNSSHSVCVILYFFLKIIRHSHSTV